ncbi:glycosyltransferase family 2 protein [Ciceribacter sp. L1K22]|uniref:glycosyltransferase family 2 protein n=1 Tax=Ciceribacter sp. L1K22 TaxID=2820275 RepID=UPI001ABDA6A2|nr:glycosyltransferase family 2 protein [Ciceribacter sp. L1K22]MBO3762218.1 glycosyltransferase family 2 protein [Ciceribacter sp. L1K22]
MAERQRLHVILVNFRTPALTIRSVGSLRKRGIAGPDNITVVDNRSGDDSVEKMAAAMPDIRIKVSPVNGGFGAGVNFGAEGIDADYLLVLNPDTYFDSDTVTPVLDQLDEMHDIGLAGLDLVNPDGSRQYGARRFYSILDIAMRRLKGLEGMMPKRVDRHLMVEETDKGRPFDAEWVMGTGFIIRRDLFARLGGMEESYFLYMEDVDLCARIWMSGRRVVYFPGFALVHDHQRQSAASPLSFAGRAHIRSLLLFARRFCLPVFKSPGVSTIVRSGRGKRWSSPIDAVASQKAIS